MLNLDKFKITLKSRGLKATPQRIAVHNAMLSLVHASAEQVAGAILEQKGSRVTTSSVYNILEELTSLGIYRQLPSPDNRMYFDVDNSSHAHLFNKASSEFRNIQEEEIMQAIGEHFRNKRYRGLKVESIDLSIVCRPSRTAKRKV